MPLPVTVTKPKRSSAAVDRQLSTLQRQILLWLAREQGLLNVWNSIREQRKTSGSQEEDWKPFYPLLKELRSKGVLWSAKRFYDDAPSRGEEATLSKALHRLEKRGLVNTYDTAEGIGSKQRTSHVKLSRTGEEAAHLLNENHGISQRELRTLPRTEIKRRSALWVLKGFLDKAATGHHTIEEYFREQGCIYVLGPNGFNPKELFADKAMFTQNFDAQVASLKACYEDLNKAAADLTKVDSIIDGVTWVIFGRSLAATYEETRIGLAQHAEGHPLPSYSYVLAVMPTSIIANILPGYTGESRP